MATKLAQATSIKEGSYIIIEGVACRVTSVQISKPGKHGPPKVRIEGMGLIDNRRKEIVLPGHDNVEVPIIEKKSAQVLSISGNKANIMDSETYETFDLEIPEELKGQVVEGCQVLYWQILDDKIMKQVKSS